MPTYIAFLRAINVGGHTVKMERLKKLFENLGFSNVSTFIASGNVIFDSSSKNTETLENKIETHLKKSLGYEVTTFIRSASELAGIARYKPFTGSEVAKSRALYVGFLRFPPSVGAKKKLWAAESKIERFDLNGRELYWLLGDRFKESKFSGPLLEKTLGQPTTLRNINTVRKLVENLCADPERGRV